jgi:long-chain acyl-CoA synthetase
VSSFTLDGRKDGAVQAAGINVFPASIAARIAAHPAVAECTVRLDRPLPEPRLKAFVVPATLDAGSLMVELERWAANNLTTPERPIRFNLGPTLPRNEMGKLADWSSAA